ncbi:MAG: hypothetical protein IPO15_01490 [Anaerolineae bacterium]|uniref:hypothetical protein n=1 Tax=Candidatus Amarolinea dominans TaxID=3140696 RepID=UPI0031354000|nr:hypothetical protein [Anaerolineae bacterium]
MGFYQFEPHIESSPRPANSRLPAGCRRAMAAISASPVLAQLQALNPAPKQRIEEYLGKIALAGNTSD